MKKVIVGEFWIPNRGGSTVVGHSWLALPGLRIYKDSPESICLQIRTEGPTAPSGKGATRSAYSSIRLDARDIDRAIEALKDLKGVLTR